MDKLIEALLEDLLSDTGEDLTEDAKTVIEDIKKGMGELNTKSIEEAMAKRREYFQSLVEIKSGLESTASTDDNDDIIDTIAALYEMFATVKEGMDADNPEEAHADLYGILNSLMYCVSDIENAIKYLKEMALLVELSKEEEAQASEDINDDVEAAAADKPMKTEGGKKYPAEAYLYVPDPKKPSTWKIRIWETPEKKVTVAQLGRAAAAIGKGFRGKKADIPEDEIAKIKSKLRSLYKKEGVKEEDMPEVLKGGKASVESGLTVESNTKENNVKGTKSNKSKDEVKETKTEDVNIEDSKAEDGKVEDSKAEDSKVEDAKSEDTEVDNEIAQLKADNQKLKERLAILESERMATARMGILKEKGLDIIFSTEEDKEKETKLLMSMSDTEFEEHVALMEKVKTAFASTVEKPGANAGSGKSLEDSKPPVVSADENKSLEDSKPPVAGAEISDGLEDTLEILMSNWD